MAEQFKYECCRDLEARRVFVNKDRPDLQMSVCPQGHRHFELTVDPAKILAQPKPVG